MEKIIAPEKNAVIETRDLSQPHGLLVGWFDAPRPRKMVLPIYLWLLGQLLFPEVEGFRVGCMNHTGLHAQEA